MVVDMVLGATPSGNQVEPNLNSTTTVLAVTWLGDEPTSQHDHQSNLPQSRNPVLMLLHWLQRVISSIYYSLKQL